MRGGERLRTAESPWEEGIDRPALTRVSWKVRKERKERGLGSTGVGRTETREPSFHGGGRDGRYGHALSGPAVRFDEAERVRTDDRAQVAGVRAPRQGGSHRRREAAVDAARWRACDLVDHGRAIWLRRVHPEG